MTPARLHSIRLLSGILSGVVLLGGCSSPDPGTADAGRSADVPSDVTADGAAPDAQADLPPMICRPGTAWTPGAPVYRVADTAAWGLMGASATGMATADLDGDGYPDLVIWDGGANTRTNLDATPPVIHTRVLLNRTRADGSGRTFVDATRMSNLLVIPAGGQGRVVNLAAFADVDNDGDPDAFTGVSVNTMPAAGQPADTGDRNAILLNDGHGVFHLATNSDITPAPTDTPQTVGAVFLDHDRDGLLDAWVGFQSLPFGTPIAQQPQFFHGHGDGTFDDQTDALGLTLGTSTDALAMGNSARPLYGVTACDVDGDGRTDLLGAAYGRQFNELFVASGMGFTDVSLASGVGADANMDYSDNISYWCYCQSNPGHCPSTIQTPPAGVCPLRGWRPGVDDQPWRLAGNTFSIACGDVNNDGHMDLYTGTIVHPDVGLSSDASELLLNDGTAGARVHFTRPGRTATGLVPPHPRTVDEGGISNGMWDFDGDGRLDIWLGGSDYDQQYGWLFHQGTDGHFTEVGAAAGFRHACPHGIALADFDLDGDLDVIVGSSTFRTWCNTAWHGRNEVRVYENITTAPNWTSIRLVGSGAGGANRDALGAVVRVTAGGVTQMREVQANWGVEGLSSELTVHVGLGATCAIDRVEVRWPDATGSVETFANVRANYRLEIRQGEGRVRYLR